MLGSVEFEKGRVWAGVGLGRPGQAWPRCARYQKVSYLVNGASDILHYIS